MMNIDSKSARRLPRMDLRRVPSLAMAFSLWLVAAPSFAQPVLRIEAPWVRATVPGQPVAAAYMKLSSGVPLRLVKVETPAAKEAQIHSMSSDGGVMRMRELDALDLPAGKVVSLAPGGMHLMLFGLSAPLREGQHVRLTFTVQDRAGKQSTHSVDAPVRQAPVE